MTNKERALNMTLLPCPFCGHKAKFVKTTHWIPFEKRTPGSIYAQIQCGFCHISTPFHRAGKHITLEGARKIWNRRIDSKKDDSHEQQ